MDAIKNQWFEFLEEANMHTYLTYLMESLLPRHPNWDDEEVESLWADFARDVQVDGATWKQFEPQNVRLLEDEEDEEVVEEHIPRARRERASAEAAAGGAGAAADGRGLTGWNLYVRDKMMELKTLTAPSQRLLMIAKAWKELPDTEKAAWRSKAGEVGNARLPEDKEEEDD